MREYYGEDLIAYCQECAMPGRLFLTTPMNDVADAVGLVDAPAQAKRLNISPGEEVMVLTDHGFRNMRWGMIMSGRKNARGRPVMETIVNARSETVFEKAAFAGIRRAVVPADGWYEWTGISGRKKPWRIRSKNEELLWFAAIFDVWNAPGGIDVAQVATITCEPNADVRDIHHRMGALLRPERISLWLNGGDVELSPAPDGSLYVEAAEGIDWSGA